jgi:hypothetical protein
MNLTSQHIGNYVLGKMVGEGGMGQVYLAEHPLIGHRIAVKVLHPECAADPENVRRFFQEARAVNDIRHENIVDIIDYGTIEGTDASTTGGASRIVYLMMELLEGESLARRIERGGFTTAEIVHIFTQCCSALSASHRKGIVHRDLKPDNIYVVRRGDDASFVKVLDFGIAKLIGPSTTESGKTRQGVVLGTPAYMSPEQCAGLGELDGRSDVYSLGVVMYECLTGRIPFGGGVSQIVAAHLAQPPLHPSVLIHSIDPALEAVVLRAMEKDPDRRFQTMDEMGGALAATARSPTRAPATRRRRLAVALGTGAAAVVAAGLTLALGTRPGPARPGDADAVAVATREPADASAPPGPAPVRATTPPPALDAAATLAPALDAPTPQDPRAAAYDAFVTAAQAGDVATAVDRWRHIPEASEYHGRGLSEYTQLRDSWVAAREGEASKLIAEGRCDESVQLAHQVHDLFPERAAGAIAIAARCRPADPRRPRPQPPAATATRPQPPAATAIRPQPPAATATRPQPPAATAIRPQPPAATATRSPVTPAARALEEARAAMEQRKYTVALDKAESVLRTSPANADALRIAVLAACKLRDARRAADYIRRTRAELRAMARQVCATNGVVLP